MLQRSIQSVLELTSNGCYSVGSGVSWSCLLQRSIHSVLGVTWNGCYNVTLEKDVVTDCHSCKTILSRFWNHCALPALPRKTRWGHIRPYPRVMFAPTSTLSRGKCDPTWGRGKCDPRAIYLSIYPSIHPTIHQSIHHLSFYLSILIESNRI